MSDENDTKTYCPAHLRMVKDIKDCEESVKKLWSRWDWLLGFIFTFMGMLLLNSVGIVILLLKAKDTAPIP